MPGTDLWYKTCRLPKDLRTTYWLAPNDLLIPLEESIGVIEWEERSATWGPDPLNPNTYVIPKHEEDPNDVDLIKSVLAMPDALPQPWSNFRHEVPKGHLESHRFHSEILDNERRVWVYTPPSYTTADTPYHFLLHFDGQVYTTSIPSPTILDNLLHERQIPPMVALLVDSPDPATRDHELASHAPFADFLIQELLPWARSRYHITTDPEQTIVGGSSHGGHGAAYVALRHPDVFGNVLAQSGSFWWKLAEDRGTAYAWLAENFMTPDRPRVNFYLNMGR